MTTPMMPETMFEGVIPTWAVPEAGDHIRVKVTTIGNGRPVLTVEYRPGPYTSWSVAFCVPYVFTKLREHDDDAAAALYALEDVAAAERRKVHDEYRKWVYPNATAAEFIHPAAGFHDGGGTDA